MFCAYPPTTEFYTLSLHDALPIWCDCRARSPGTPPGTGSPACAAPRCSPTRRLARPRSEEHTSELQSRRDLVCRLLLERKKAVSGGIQGYGLATDNNTVGMGDAGI